MITNPLGFAGRDHQTARTRHGWSKALQLAPDLYPGVGGKRFRATLLQRAYEFAGGQGDAPALIIDAVEMLHAGSLVLDDFEDGSLTRRNQPALHRVVGPARAVNAVLTNREKRAAAAIYAFTESRLAASAIAHPRAMPAAAAARPLVPITAAGVVTLVVSDLGLFAPLGEAFAVRDLAPGVTLEEVRAVTACPIIA
jgi:hypothetical protein